MSQAANQNAQVVVTRTYTERVMFIGQPEREKIEYLKRLGFTRREGQWTRYNNVQTTIAPTALEQTLKA